MGRCLMLLGLVAVTVGVVALTSQNRKQGHPSPTPPKEPTVPPVPRPHFLRLPGPKYHMALSIN